MELEWQRVDAFRAAAAAGQRYLQSAKPSHRRTCDHERHRPAALGDLARASWTPPETPVSVLADCGTVLSEPAGRQDWCDHAAEGRPARR
jgi:hypothetical protein